jgi:predicted ATPase
MKKGTVPVQGGPRKEPVHLRLGFQGELVGYAIDLGLPVPADSAFNQDPEIKRECVWAAPNFRPSTVLADRRGPSVRLRRSDGE